MPFVRGSSSTLTGRTSFDDEETEVAGKDGRSSVLRFFSFFVFFPLIASNGSGRGFFLIAPTLLSSSSSEKGLGGATSSSSRVRFEPVSFPFKRAVSLVILWWPSGIEAPTPNLNQICLVSSCPNMLHRTPYLTSEAASYIQLVPVPSPASARLGVVCEVPSKNLQDFGQKPWKGRFGLGVPPCQHHLRWCFPAT